MIDARLVCPHCHRARVITKTPPRLPLLEAIDLADFTDRLNANLAARKAGRPARIAATRQGWQTRRAA